MEWALQSASISDTNWVKQLLHLFDQQFLKYFKGPKIWWHHLKGSSGVEGWPYPWGLSNFKPSHHAFFCFIYSGFMQDFVNQKSLPTTDHLVMKCFLPLGKGVFLQLLSCLLPTVLGLAEGHTSRWLQAAAGPHIALAWGYRAEVPEVPKASSQGSQGKQWGWTRLWKALIFHSCHLPGAIHPNTNQTGLKERALFYLWKSWRTERVGNLPKVISSLSDKARVWTQVVWLQGPCP